MALDAMDDTPDEALLVLYANGDRAAAQALTARLAPRVMRLAVHMLGDVAEAEDVTQEAMLRLWKIAPQWRPGEAQVATWLHRVARNLCTDRLRARRWATAPIEAAGDPADLAPGAAERMVAGERAQAVVAALGQLPERQREAVILRHIEGLSNPEIAERMEVSVEAVESLTARGRRALARLLAPLRQEEGDGP